MRPALAGPKPLSGYGLREKPRSPSGRDGGGTPHAAEAWRDGASTLQPVLTDKRPPRGGLLIPLTAERTIPQTDLNFFERIFTAKRVRTATVCVDMKQTTVNAGRKVQRGAG